MGNPETLIAVCVIAVVIFAAVAAILSRYRKCPSDKIMVIYGKVGTDKNGQAKKRKMYPRRRGFYRTDNPVVPVS